MQKSEKKKDSSQITPLAIRQGPTKNSQCTDIICWILFLACFGLALTLLIIHMKDQSLVLLIRPINSYNQPCGVNYLKGYQKIFYPDQNNIQQTICVQQCPNSNDPTLCFKEPCPIGYETEQIDNICIPKQESENQIKIKDQLKQVFHIMLHSLFYANDAILICLGMQILLGLSFTLMTMWLPVLSTYLFYIFGIGILVGLSGLFIYQFVQKRFPLIQTEISQRDSIIFLTIGIFLILLCIIFISILIYKRNKLKFLTHLLKMASNFLYQNPYVFIGPILQSLFTLLLYYFFIQLFFNLQADGNQLNQTYSPYVRLKSNKNWFWWVNGIIFFIFWFRGIIIAFSSFEKTASSTYWYYNQKNNEQYSRVQNILQQNLIRTTLKWIFRYHLGTIIFGGLTISNTPFLVMTGIRKFIEYNEKVIDQKKNNCGVCCAYFNIYGLCCCGLIRYLTKFVYLEVIQIYQTILQSKNFIKASKEAFLLNKRNKTIFSEIYNMGNFLSNSAKINMIIISTFIGYITMVVQSDHNFTRFTSILFPLIAIASFFFDAIILIGQNLMLCYTVDLQIERYHYGKQQPKSCPKQLKSIINQAKSMLS